MFGLLTRLQGLFRLMKKLEFSPTTQHIRMHATIQKEAVSTPFDGRSVDFPLQPFATYIFCFPPILPLVRLAESPCVVISELNLNLSLLAATHIRVISSSERAL